MTITEAVAVIPMARSTIMLLVERGAVRPRKRKTHLTPSGYYFEFSAADVAKLRRLKRAAGRPKNT